MRKDTLAPAPIDDVDGLFLDLDGVVYQGRHAIPGAIDALTAAREKLPLIYLTNNASRTDEQVAEHLRHLGLAVSADEVITSPQAAIRVLAQHVPARSRVLMIGGDGLRVELEKAGFVPVHSASESPAAVVQGFAPSLGWADLAQAAFALQNTKIPWIATNMDWTIPVEGGIAPGNGSLVSAVHNAAGRMPDAVAGKPETPMFELARARFGLKRPLMIGDRLDTDIRGAHRAGIPSVLVLTGIDRGKALFSANTDERPTYVLSSLAELSSPYAAPVEHRGQWRSGGAAVHVDERRLVVDSRGTHAETLRAASAAIWNSGIPVYQFDVDNTMRELAEG